MARLLADVIVIGAGPTGCMAAIGAKRADPSLEVIMIEPEMKNRHRIGEALLTGTIMTLEDAGILQDIADAGFHKKVGASYVWGKSRDPWYVNYPADNSVHYPDQFKNSDGSRFTIHVPRHEYDYLLKKIAVKNDIKIINASVTNAHIQDNDNDKSVQGLVLSDGTIAYAKQYIDCTGQVSFLGRRISQRLPVGSPKIARYAYTKDIDWDKASRAGFDIHRTNIISSNNGWIWIIHLGEASGGLTSFGFVSTPDILSKLTIQNCVEAFPETEFFGFKPEEGYLNPRTFDGKQASQFYGHPDYSFSCRELHGSNWSLAGDAAVFIDPILSQGVTLGTHYGFLRGKAAAAHLNGSTDANLNVTRHYRNEAAIMHDVVNMWYENNKSVDNWTLTATNQAQNIYGKNLSPEKAFRWITNLENIRDEYDPYPASERLNISNMLIR